MKKGRSLLKETNGKYIISLDKTIPTFTSR